MSTSLPAYMSSFSDNLAIRRFVWAVVLLVMLGFSISGVQASDWDEDSPKKGKTKTIEKGLRTQAQERKSEPVGTVQNDGMSSAPPLSGKIEKEGEASLRIQRPGHSLQADLPEGDHGLQGLARDGALSPMTPKQDASTELLQGKAVLLGGKGAKSGDPDEDDVELMVEWDLWHNRFLRAVQLGTQEILNNPDPEDYERLRADPHSGNFTSRYPLGVGAAFSCIVTADGQIKNLETIEASGFPKYDRAVLRAVQQLAGTQLLKFPRGSHRLTVIQPGRIKTGNSSDFKYYHFGDVEHVRQK